MIKRKTIQQALVLEAVNKLKSHATADEIYQLIVEDHPTISRGTVYRNLNQLSENGDIRKLEVPGAADRFDHRPHNHYHVKCLNCGKVFDVEMDYMEDLEKNIKDSHGFEFSGHDLMFRGICPDCKKEQE